MKPDDIFTWTPRWWRQRCCTLPIEFADETTAAWLLDHGANVNMPVPRIDADGFGGQTPLFHTAMVWH